MNQIVNCDALGALDNNAARAIIDKAILEAVADLDDRAHEDGKARKVSIELTFEKRKNGDVEVSVEATAKCPKRRTASTVARVKSTAKGAQLQFNDAAPDDPDQTTIDQHMGKRRGKAAESEES